MPGFLERAIQPGAAVSFGLQGTHTESAGDPQAVALDGEDRTVR